MSTLGSSVINKSGKKFAPKAPSRRPAAPASTQASTRPSIDRQIQSHTPQPQTPWQQLAAPSTPSQLLPTPAPSQQQATVASERLTREDASSPTPQPSRRTSVPGASGQQSGATLIAVPSRNTPAQTQTSPAPVLARKRPLERGQTSDTRDVSHPAEPYHVLGHSTSPLASTGANLTSTDLTSYSQPRILSREHRESSSNSEPNVLMSSNTVGVQGDVQSPAAKRRRVEEPLQKVLDRQSPTAEASANVPIPTTEAQDAVVEASLTGDADSSSLRVVTANKPQSSTGAKRKQPTDNAAAKVVMDATQGASSRSKKPGNSTKRKRAERNEGEVTGATANPSTESGSQSGQGAATTKPKRKYTKRKSKQNIQDVAAEVVENAVQGSTKDPKRRGRKSQRAPTPEGADKVVISPSTTKMSELCKDNRIGRKSAREKDLEEFERAKFVKRKQKELQEVMGQAEPESDAGQAESAEQRLDSLGRQREREESVANNVPNTIIVNGQIQIDEDSLQIDRHAGAAAEREAEQLEAIDETDLNRKVNSFSWLNRDKSGSWNELLTERFYEGLRMFGTDFEMISKMFPGRTRHKIKLKFVKEEKINHDKIKATLLGEKLPVDLPELEKMAGVEFDDPKELERDMEADRKRLEEEMLAEKRAMDEAREEREAQIAAERAAAGEESSAKENRRGKGKKKKGEKGKGEKGSSKRNVKRGNRMATTGAERVLGELGDEVRG